MALIRQVGMIGCGSMGGQIAEWLCRHGVNVVLFDVNENQAHQLRKRLFAENQIECPIAAELSGLGECDLIIESILEDAVAKSQLFRQLETCIGSSPAIFASNTSTIKISEIASQLETPSRLIGTHFFHPVDRRSLVEVIQSDHSDPPSVERARIFLTSVDKQPIVVKDTPGFIVNRLLFPYLAEAMQLLQNGHMISEVDHAACDYGMPWGPFELADAIGLDVAYFSAKSLFMELGNRAAMSPILPRLVKKKAFGKKTGSGFYVYDSKANKGLESPLATEIVAKYVQSPSPIVGTIIERMMYAVLVEASILLEEQIVETPALIDLALVKGLDFPESPRGIFGWAESLGPENVVQRLEQLANLGERFHPTKWLIDQAAAGTFS